MTPSELLEPRYKVIAAYPDMPKDAPVGFVYDFTTGNWDKRWATFMEEYPHLFRKMAWHENREINKMPMYLRFESSADKEVAKVRKYCTSSYHYGWGCYLEGERSHRRFLSECDLFPSTEEAYTKYFKLPEKK